jgi:diketogulonate reductase-like aldo/keto reductase
MRSTRTDTPAQTSRRTFIRGAAGLGLATASLPAETMIGMGNAQAQPAGTAQTAAGPVITRTVPRTNEALPTIGLGTFLTFDVIPGQTRDHLREVIQRYWQAGARVVDTSPLYGSGEISIGHFATSLGITDQVFVANKIWSTGEFLSDESHARRSLEQSLGRLWRDRIDLMQCHSLVNVDLVVPYLQAWKKEGRIRYLGITHYENPYHAPLASWIKRGNLDFVQVNYSIFNRAAENRILPAAADRGVAVLVNMPLEKARLHRVVENQPLPAFAKEIGAENWAQFFLKWVISNPNVTCALPSTSNPEHAAENIGALRGPLPDQKMRARMVRHMETIPGFDRIADMPWYPGKRYPGIIARAQAELRARS